MHVELWVTGSNPAEINRERERDFKTHYVSQSIAVLIWVFLLLRNYYTGAYFQATISSNDKYFVNNNNNNKNKSL